MTPEERDTRAHRVALAAASAALAAGLVYIGERAFIHLRLGASVPLLIVRERFIGFYQALAIAACFGLAAAWAVLALVQSPERIAKLESLLMRAALPLIALAAVLAMWLP